MRQPFWKRAQCKVGPRAGGSREQGWSWRLRYFLPVQSVALPGVPGDFWLSIFRQDYGCRSELAKLKGSQRWAYADATSPQTM